jgi:membrane protease YdiL (CAAX protease family)
MDLEENPSLPLLPDDLQPVFEQGWLRALLYFFAFVVVALIFQSLSLLLLSVMTGEGITALTEAMDTSEGVHFFTYIQAFSLVGTLLVTYLFRRFIDKQPFQTLGFDYRGWLNDAMLGFLLGFALIAIGFVLLWGMGLLKVSGIGFKPLAILLYIVLLVMVALNEEIAVRGYMLNNLMQSLNKYTALAISSVVFAALHLLNPSFSVLSFINIVLAGILLGVYYIHRQNLWFPIALHFAWNFFQGPVFGFEVSGVNLSGIITQEVSGSAWLTGGEFGFEGSAILSFLLIGAIVATEKWFNRPIPIDLAIESNSPKV